MQCCPNCFSHDWLKQRISEMSKQTAQCDYCGEEDVPVVEVDELSGYFHNLLAMYVVADDFDSGEPLIALIQWHWNIFNEDEMSEDSRVELLEEIANADWDDDDGEPMLDGRELYRPLGGPFHTTHRERWEEFCSNVREHPEEPLPFGEFFEEELCVLEVRLPIGTLMQRSRRGYNFNEHGDRLAFQGNDIGSPPAAKASAGRANRAGQQVLYCADEEKTAIAEVRPPRGYYVSVGSFALNREVRILDLTKERPEINPFVTETLKWEVEIESLLNAFAEEMSRPLERDEDQTHYVPCQALAEFIKNAKFDGIRYPSALNPDGHNIILFDPGVADFRDSKLVTITEVSLAYEEDNTPTFEERLKNYAKQADLRATDH